MLEHLANLAGRIDTNSRKSSALSSFSTPFTFVAVLTLAGVGGGYDVLVYGGALAGLALMSAWYASFERLRQQDPDLLRSEHHVERKLALAQRTFGDSQNGVIDGRLLLESSDPVSGTDRAGTGQRGSDVGA